MKKHASIIGIISLALIISVSCSQQPSEADLQEKLAEIREGQEEVISQINQAMNSADINEFRSGIQNALDNLDNQIEDYHTEMDNANRRIDKETRDAIIEMKQQKTAIEFKLDLLENSDDNDRSVIGMTDGGGAERTDDATGPDREYTGSDRRDGVTSTDRTVDRTGPQRPGQMTSPERTGEWAGGPENLGDSTQNESEMQRYNRDASPDAEEMETEVYRTPEPSQVEQSAAERSERSASERTVTERTGTERSGIERSGAERSGTESGTERSGVERSATERTGTESSGIERSGTLRDTVQTRGTSGAERSGIDETTETDRSVTLRDTSQTNEISGAERTSEIQNEEDDNMSLYYQELLDEIKNDVQELRSEIEEFTQREL